MSAVSQLRIWELAPAPLENISLDNKNAAVKTCATRPDWLTCFCKVQVHKDVAVGVLFCGGSFDTYFLKHS